MTEVYFKKGIPSSSKDQKGFLLLIEACPYITFHQLFYIGCYLHLSVQIKVNESDFF